MHARVVGCAPVPNARPGSTTTDGSSGGGDIHGGPIQSPPARTGRWNSFQRSSQPADTSSDLNVGERVADRRLAGVVGEDGKLLGPADRSLLEPVGEAVEEPRRCDLYCVVRPRCPAPAARRGGARSAQRALQAAEEALVLVGLGCVGIRAERAVDVLEQAPLLGVEGGRHRDVEPDVQRAATCSAQ